MLVYLTLDKLDAVKPIVGVPSRVLLAVLAYFYGRITLSTRAKYPLGLFVFSTLLLLQSGGTAAAYLFLSRFLEEAVPYMFIMAAF